MSPLTDLSGAHHHVHALNELTKARLQLLGHPEVVLVTPSDKVTPAHAPGLQEVLNQSEPMRVPSDVDGEMTLLSEDLQELEGVIARSVVTQHKFIGKMGLGGEGVQLFPNVLRPSKVAMLPRHSGRPRRPR